MKPLYTSVTMKKLTASWDKYFLMILEKKTWQVYTKALYREKLWNYCIHVWRWKKWPLLGTNISDDSEKKKAWQMYTKALYREKLWNYYIHVWRWKNKMTPSWDKYFLMILKRKAWQVYTNAYHREKLCNHCIQVWWWKKSDDSEKKCDKCIQCII